MSALAEALTDEEWRPIIGFAGFYEVSNLGRVRSLRQRHGRGIDRQRRAPHIRTACNGTNGYLGLTLCRPGRRRMATIHRLVLEAFVGPCPPGHEAGHLNHVRHDNRRVNARGITWRAAR